MNSEQELLQKLMVSKKIMERHNTMGRGNSSGGISTPMVENYEPVNATYNLPQEFLQEESRPTVIPQGPPTADRIAKSKLPDEIKRLMMEHPIEQPNMGLGGSPTLSNDLVEKAARLMNTKANGDVISETKSPKPQTQQSIPGLSKNQLKELMRETIEEVLGENGLLTESETKSNDVIKLKIGEHIFEGKLTKIKKVSK